MNLAWLAAVLEPRDIVASPRFPDDDYDSDDPVRLAAVILGRQWRPDRYEDLTGEGSVDSVTLVERCLQTDTIAVGVAELASRLTGPRPHDLAEAAALALVACSAAAELDDYGTCFQVLDVQLRWTSEVQTPDDALVRAALLQQKAVRLRDSGRPHLKESTEAATILSRLDIHRCSVFRTSPGVSWSSSTTVERIRENLIDAIASLVPVDVLERASIPGLPTLRDKARADTPDIIVRTALDRAENYANYVGQVFARSFAGRGRTVGGPSRPDLFYVVLALELIGHGAVYSAREELALLRLVQADGDSRELADALRLLRHSAAKKELDRALRHFQAAGPLSVLSHDARQILRTRMAPELLRTVELQVLLVAAELLAPAEARVALDAIRTGLAADGPPNLPGAWELPILRKEVAWAAAAALGNVCDAAGEVAELLLDEAAKQQEDQLLDSALRRALAGIEWPNVPNETRDAWIRFLRARAADLPSASELMTTRIGTPLPIPGSVPPLEALARQLNTAISGGAIDPSLTRDGVPLVRDRLTQIRSSAASGSYAFGGVSAADIAAGLVIVANVEELWSELTEFLLDPRVQRDDRTPAFERLARADIVLPQEVVVRFHAQAEQLLATSSPEMFESPLTPYPSALRFMAAHGILDDVKIYEAIAMLMGATDPTGPREAAATVAVVAAKSPHSQLLVLALALAYDGDVDVRALAGRALAVLAPLDDPLAVVALRRLTELLAEDGLLAPLLTLRALIDIRGTIPTGMRRQIEELYAQHPSRSVRIEAGRLLQLKGSAGRIEDGGHMMD
jgi:hypothetical protein